MPRALTTAEKTAFLERLSTTGNVVRSASLCGLNPRMLYPWRRTDTAFRTAWAEAVARGKAAVMVAIARRAEAKYSAPRPPPGPQIAAQPRGPRFATPPLEDTPFALDYQPRAAFAPWHARTQRWSVTASHRRSGKTVSRVAALIEGALTCPRPRPRFGYIAPWLKQAKAVAWDYFKQYAAPAGAAFHETELRIDFRNGGQVRLFGADNPDGLRGLYLDGVVLDEFAIMDPAIWPVVRPTLSDRLGWADFIGTPNGHNEFHRVLTAAQGDATWYSAVLKASETAILTADELASARKDLGEDQYAQEYECSFEAAIRGAYYGKELAAADADKRIGALAWDMNLEVHTAWDLGIGDATSIWMWQRAGQEVRVIDYYEASGVGLEHYVRTLRERPYTYGRHVFPHDVKVRELGTGKSREETLRSLGVYVETAPNIGLEDGINAVRRLLPRCRFDAGRCARGLEALRQYQTAWDDRARMFQRAPRHDWTSHAADAFRYLALAADRSDEPMYPTPKPDLRWIV